MAELKSTISSSKLCGLTGLSDRQHRMLAADGHFPKPVKGEYDLVPTLTGLFRYYREGDGERLPSYFDSIASCAAGAGIPEPVLKKAKRAGCGAFKSGRVYVKPLLVWLFQNKGCGLAEVFSNKERQEARLLEVVTDIREMERDEMRGDLIRTSEVQRRISDALLPIRQQLLSLPSEAASQCNPENPEAAREALQNCVDRTLTSIRAGLPKP